MRRTMIGLAVAGALVLLTTAGMKAQGSGGYTLVPNWPTLPQGMWFGLRDAPPPPAEREAQAAARRARGAMPGGGGPPTNQPGISGLAIDQQDRIFVFNRGPKPVMVFDTAGKLVMAGADQELNGKRINSDWQHSGAVDWEGNVWVIERDAHRIVKLSPKLDKFLLQLGTTMEKGNSPTHLDLPSGIAVLRSGNIVVTDGYGNNRVILYDKTGKFIKQVGKGAGGPADKGTGPGEWVLPHKLAVDADETSTTSGRSRTSGTRGTWPFPERAPKVSGSSPTICSSGSTSSRSPMASSWRPGVHRAPARVNSTGCTASSSTRRARSTPPIPTDSGCKSSCQRALRTSARWHALSGLG
jgi:hypothetical protein